MEILGVALAAVVVGGGCLRLAKYLSETVSAVVHNSVRVAGVLVIVVGLLFSFTWLALAIGSLAYLATLPLSWRAYHERMSAAATPVPDNVEHLPLRNGPYRPEVVRRFTNRDRKSGP